MGELIPKLHEQVAKRVYANNVGLYKKLGSSGLFPFPTKCWFRTRQAISANAADELPEAVVAPQQERGQRRLSSLEIVNTDNQISTQDNDETMWQNCHCHPVPHSTPRIYTST